MNDLIESADEQKVKQALKAIMAIPKVALMLVQNIETGEKHTIKEFIKKELGDENRTFATD